MDILLYIIIFLVGACIGSVYATLIHRISKEKRMFSIHSHCSKCGEKLSILEQIPIFSYIFFKGKCKYCKKKIAKAYIVLELLTAIIFTLTAYIFNLSNANIINVLSFIFINLYFSYLILVAGIDLKSKQMPANLLSYGIAITLIYMVYLLFTKNTTIYVSAMLLGIMVVLLLANIINTKKRASSSYVIDLLTMLLVMLIFTGEIVCILTITATLISIAIYILINKIKQSKSKIKKDKSIYSTSIRIVYIMSILNIFIFLTLLNINK